MWVFVWVRRGGGVHDKNVVHTDACSSQFLKLEFQI